MLNLAKKREVIAEMKALLQPVMKKETMFTLNDNTPYRFTLCDVSFPALKDVPHTIEKRMHIEKGKMYTPPVLQLSFEGGYAFYIIYEDIERMVREMNQIVFQIGKVRLCISVPQ